MKSKIFTYLVLLTLLLGLTHYVDAQVVTSKIFGVGPNTQSNTADDVVLARSLAGFEDVTTPTFYVNVEVSGLPVLTQDFNLDIINFFASLPSRWTTISLTSPKGTTYVLANKSLGSWPGYLYDATMNRVNPRKIARDCSENPAHNGTGDINSVKSLNPTNSFIGEDPNGTWKLEIGPTTIGGVEGIYYDRISLVFRYAIPYLATSNVTKPTSCTAADGNIKFQLYVGGCNTKGGFYKINGGVAKFVPFYDSGLSAEITEGLLTAGTYEILVFPAINSTTPDLTKVHSTLINIEDSTPPAIACPPAQTVTLDETGKKIFNITHPTATDNCGTPTTVLNVKYYDGASDAIGGLSYNNLKVSPGVSKPYNIKGVGKVVFEFVTKDASGLTTTCSTTVTSLANTNYCANDTEAPFFPFGECRDYFIVYDANSQASFSFRAPYYFDNCEIATRKLTGTYLGGASPVTGATTFTADFVSGVYSPYTIKGAGSLELKFEVTDKKGNKGTCTSIITTKIRTGPCVNDLTKPVLTNCQANSTLNLNNTTNQATFKVTTPLMSDNCGVDSTRITMTYLDGAKGIYDETYREWFNIKGGVTSNDFTVVGTGRVEFNFYVYDQSQNESSCKTTITVVANTADTEKPVITGCPASHTVTLAANGVANSIVIFPKAMDNVGVTSSVLNMRFFDGATDVANKTEYLGVFSATDANRDFNIKGVGRLVLEWIYKDAAGNTSICTSTITSISPTTDPCSTFNPVLSIAGTNCVNNEMSIAGVTAATYIDWKKDNQIVSTTAASTTKATSGSTVAGNSNGTAGTGVSEFKVPTGVFVDKVGNVYVSDDNNQRVMKWAPGATSGIKVAGGTGGPGLSQLNGPKDVFVDNSGNIYVLDIWNNRVVKWAPGASEGIKVAGGAAGAGADQFSAARGLFVDGSGNIYVADQNNHRIQKWAPNATTGVTVAGGTGIGTALNQLSFPSAVALDATGNIYVVTSGSQVKKFPVNSVSGTSGVIVANEEVNTVVNGLFIDGAGFMYLCSNNRDRIMKFPPNSTPTTVGTVVAGANGSGNGANQLNKPAAVYVDAAGNIFIVDQANNRVQKWTQSTTIVPKYTPTAAGTYTADVFTIAGCKKTSNSLVIATCGPSPTDVVCTIADACVYPGSMTSIPVTVKGFKNVSGFQFELKVSNNSTLSIENVKNADLPPGAAEFNKLPNGNTLVIWTESTVSPITLADGTKILEIVVKATTGFNAAGSISVVEPVIVSTTATALVIGSATLCVSTGVTPKGKILNPKEKAFAGVRVNLTSTGNPVANVNTGADGGYSFATTPPNNKIEPTKNDELIKGVNAADLLKIRAHILKKILLPDNYSLIAADVNRDEKINVADIVFLQQAVLLKSSSFPNNNTSWRFLPKRLDISSNPLKKDWPEHIDLSESGLDYNNLDFVAIKVGDVDNNSLLQEPKVGKRNAVVISIPDTIVTPSNNIRVPVYITGPDQLAAIEMVINYNKSIVNLTSIESTQMSGWTAQNYSDIDGSIKVVWFDNSLAGFVPVGPVMTLVFENIATTGMTTLLLSDIVLLDSGLNDVSSTVDHGSITFLTSSSDETSNAHSIKVYPNPFTDVLNIEVDLDTPERVNVILTDVTGKMLRRVTTDKVSGSHRIQIKDLDYKGVIFVRLESNSVNKTVKVIRI